MTAQNAVNFRHLSSCDTIAYYKQCQNQNHIYVIDLMQVELSDMFLKCNLPLL